MLWRGGKWGGIKIVLEASIQAEGISGGICEAKKIIIEPTKATIIAALMTRIGRIYADLLSPAAKVF